MRGVLVIIAVCILGVVLLVAAVLGPLFQFQQQQQQQTGVATGGDFANAAQLLQSKLFGSRANDYDPNDPLMKNVVVPYWAKSCQNPDGSLCNLAKPGQLNCVEFVTAAYDMAGDPLPVHPDAETFWTTYQNMSGWQEIPSPSSFPGAAHKDPSPGDMVIWKGGRHVEKQADGTMKEVEYGHIGVLVSYAPPVGGKDGMVEVAEANAPGNKFAPVSLNPYVPSSQPGNTYTMAIHQDYTISTWGAYVDDSTKPPTQYSAYSILGFIHQIQQPQVALQQTGPYATSLPPGVTAQMPYVQAAIDAANTAGIPSGYFVRQIQQESGFNRYAQSPVGAEGIAQFMPATAAGLGVNPWDPASALPGAARMMAASVRTYRGDYAKALAAYNGGDGVVQYAEQQVTAALKARQTGQALDWRTYLPNETKNYIHIIMGI